MLYKPQCVQVVFKLPVSSVTAVRYVDLNEELSSEMRHLFLQNVSA